MDDDQRSGQYDVLLAAEARAQKKGVGLHSKKEPSLLRVADVAGVSLLKLMFTNLIINYKLEANIATERFEILFFCN